MLSNVIRKVASKFTFWMAISVCLLPSSLAQNNVDVIFVMDGSGSISSVDFALQKAGLSEAFNSTVILPRDGTIAVALVQFAGSTTRTEIAYTLVNSEADATSLINQLAAINQIGGLTNPGDGVNAAMGILAVEGRLAANWSICVSTDGLPNSGANIATALLNGQSNGLDTFGVIAVEDPPVALEADFQQFYGPLVFGGGNLQVVRNAVEFANGVGLSCLISDEAVLVGLEAIQVLQDWEDSIPLVQNKTTIVRAHFEPASGATAIVSGRLRGIRGGVPLPGSPLTAMAPGFIIARPDAASRRGSLLSSLNFRLPPDWLTGDVSLIVEGFGTNISCSETADTDDDCSVEVRFEEVAAPEVRLVAVSHTQGTNTVTPTPAHLTELESRLNAIFPVAQVVGSIGSLSITGPVNLTKLNTQLETLRIQDGCTIGCDRQYYGVLRGAPLGGLANGIPGTVSCGNMPANGLIYGRNRHAHELGHTLGSEHVTYCTATSLNPPPFPTTNTLTVGSEVRATIGPMTLGVNRLVYGLDTHRMSVVNPNDNYELMSYCSSGRWRWVSDFTYGNLITNINGVFGRMPLPVNFSWDPDLGEMQHLSDIYQARPDFLPDPTPPQSERANITEGFDDIAQLPDWVAVNNSDIPGTSSWFQGNDTVFNAQSGSTTSYIGANFNNTAGTTISNWLMTPVLNLADFQSLSFWTRTTTGSQFPDRLQVRLSTNGSSTNAGTSSVSVGDFDELLLEINPNLQLNGYPDVWTQFTINRDDLPVTSGSGRVAFRYFVTSAGSTGVNSDYIGIDSFSYQEQANPLSGFLLARGIIDINNPSVSFQPFDGLSSSAALPSVPVGSHSLRVYNAGNQLLEEISFEPSPMHADYGPNGGDDPGEAFFLIPVAQNPNMAYIDIMDGNVMIGRKTASPNRPVIQLTYPNGGEILSSEQVSLSWSASDPDSDPLTYSVQYSADGGTTWSGLVVDLEASSLTIPRNLLTASSQALVRVSANDGFHSVSDSSDAVFTVSNNEPDLVVGSPRNSSRYIGIELLHLDARAQDKEDGLLGNTRISFESDRNGFLGFNRDTIDVSFLSEGSHNITITATDVDGSITSETTTILISRVGTFNCSAALLPQGWPNQTVLQLVDTLNQFCGNP